MTDANVVGLKAKHVFVSGWSEVRISAPKGVSARLKASCTPTVSPEGDPATQFRLVIEPDGKGSQDLELLVTKDQAVLVRGAAHVAVSPDVKAKVLVELQPGQTVSGSESAVTPAQTASQTKGT